jgi:hypothetical protein
LDEFEIQQHYDEFFEEVFVEMEKVRNLRVSFLFIFESETNGGNACR